MHGNNWPQCMQSKCVQSKCTETTRKLMVLPIKAYRYFLSPWLGSNCRFEPSCSQYAISAIEQLGVVAGCFRTIMRLLKCHPWCKGGYDPVIKINRDKT